MGRLSPWVSWRRCSPESRLPARDTLCWPPSPGPRKEPASTASASGSGPQTTLRACTHSANTHFGYAPHWENQTTCWSGKKKKKCFVIITFSGPYIRWGWPSGVPWRPWGSSPNQHFSGMLWKDKINTSWSNRQNVVHDRHYSVRQNQSKHTRTQGLANSLQPLMNK